MPSLPEGESFVLDGPEGHHAATVQRLRVGESLVLGDGRGGTATAEVTAVGRGTLSVRVLSREYAVPPAQRLVVVQAIAKGDRGELAVQAMTEAGVDRIVPWSAARSIARWTGSRGHDRWVATAREAAKQSHRPWLPTVDPLASTVDVVSRFGPSALVLDAAAPTRLSAVDLPESDEVVIVVGPEGGITPDELASFAAAGAIPVRLGDTVLRTSTAGVAALAVLSARLGRW